MIRDPRVAFDQLFGAGGSPAERAARVGDEPEHSRLDRRGRSHGVLKRSLGPNDTVRLDRYLDNVRELERGALRASKPRTGAARSLASCQEAPAGVPDSFEEHVKLMFDLQALAFAVGRRRACSAFKIGRDASPHASIRSPE